MPAGWTARGFQPYSSRGKRVVGAIILVFTLYTCLSLGLSARSASGSQNRADVLRIADRQRTLAERYEKEVLLARAGAPSAVDPVAHALEASVAVLLDGGLAPALPGDDDEKRIDPIRGDVVRRQLRQEQLLIADLIRSGTAYAERRPAPATDAAGERFAGGLTPLRRLTALTGLTSNVSLNVARSIGDESNRRISSLITLERWLAGAGLAIFALLSLALVSSTQRRNAHFRSLVASTTDLVLVFSDETCRYASTSVLAMLDAPIAAVLGGGLILRVHPDDRAGVRSVLLTGAPAAVAFRLDDAVHGWRDLEANVTDLRDDRHVRGIVLNARDVTERNRAGREREHLLRQERFANERLRELDKLKDEFVALVSHEVRTPLTSIRGYLELLDDEQLSDEQRLYTEIIGRNSARLLRLINDLLFIAQIEGGHLTVEHDEIDLAPIVADALAAAAPAATAAEIGVTVDAGETLLLVGDAGRLAQLIDNLLSNAIKFTPAGGTVGVRAGRTAEQVWVEVRDNGIGIDDADQERLFNKFFRTSAATESSIQGTGLGLAISKAIVHAHGGTIAVESRAGAGSTFRIELPAGDRARAMTARA
jgi:signal transduction histidine kinase